MQGEIKMTFSSPQVQQEPVCNDQNIAQYCNMRQRRGSVSAEVLSEPPLKPRKFSQSLSTLHEVKTEQERAQLRDSLKNNILFANLDAVQTDMLIDSFDRKHYISGDTVIRQDEGGHLFYIVHTGRLSVYLRVAGSLSRERKVLSYQEGDSFGELALMYNQPRAANVKTDESCTLWTLDRLTFISVLRSTNVDTKDHFQRCLLSVPLLRNLDHDELSKLVDVMEPITFDAGQLIIRQGELGDKLFIITEGEAVATRVASADEEEVKPISYKAGDFFGEMALLTEQARAATVVARSKCVLCAVDKDAFLRMLGPCEELLQARVDDIHTISNPPSPEIQPLSISNFRRSLTLSPMPSPMRSRSTEN